MRSLHPPARSPLLPPSASALRLSVRACSTASLAQQSSTSSVSSFEVEFTEAAPGDSSPVRPSAPRARPAPSTRADNVLPDLSNPKTAQEVQSLLRIPCVGRKNLLLLREKGGLSCYEALEESFIQKHNREPLRMAEYLRTTVSIRPQYAKTIADHVANTLWAKENGHASPDGGPPSSAPSERLTICVEGNISAGKSTFLNTIHGSEACGQRVRVVPEPVERWTNIPGLSELRNGKDVPISGEHNILAAYYKNPERWGYTFQNWVFFTRFMQEKTSQHPSQSSLLSSGGAVSAEALLRSGVDYRMMERSVFSDRLVFVEALKDKSTLNDMELAIYGSWFDFMLKDQPSLVPDAFIYLRAEPTTCHSRMTVRARGEEAGVPLDYLSILHDKHEGWFRQSSGGGLYHPRGDAVLGGSEVVSLIESYPKAGLEMSEDKWRGAARELILDLLPACIREQVVFMRTSPTSAAAAATSASPSEVFMPGATRTQFAPPVQPGGSGLHHEHVIRRVPALILDCDGHLDISNDMVAREDYARKVAEFYEFVAKLKKHVYPVLGQPASLPEKWGHFTEKDVRVLEGRLRKARAESRRPLVHLPSAAEQRSVAASRC